MTTQKNNHKLVRFLSLLITGIGLIIIIIFGYSQYQLAKNIENKITKTNTGDIKEPEKKYTPPTPPVWPEVIKTAMANDDRFTGFEEELCFEMSENSFSCVRANQNFEKHQKNLSEYIQTLFAEKYVPNMSMLPENEMPLHHQYYNNNFFAFDGSYITVKKEVFSNIESGKYSEEDLISGAFILGIEGKYAEAENMYNKLCTEHIDQKDLCTKEKIVIKGKATTDKNEPLVDVTITALGQGFETTTDTDGNYILEVVTYPFKRLRIQATKRGYSLSGGTAFNVLENGSRQFSDINFILHSPLRVVTLNNQTKKVVRGTGAVATNQGFIIKTERSTYQLPYDAMIFEDEDYFNGEFDMFLFEFDRSSNLDNLLYNDIFSETMEYIGDLMQTYGMPFVMFVNSKGETIHVSSTNPMTLTYKTPETDAVDQEYENRETMLDKSWEYLYQYSQKEGGYPLNIKVIREASQQMPDVDTDISFPEFWVRDHKTGLWRNVGMRFLQKKGIIESPFFTLYNE